LRPLPFDESHRLAAVSETDLATGFRGTVAPQNYFDWIRRQDVFETVAASANAGRYVTADAPIENLRVVRVTASLFDVLRVAPAIGRRFTAEDERPGATPIAILSHRFWQRRFGGSADIIGQRIRVESGSVDIVGVMPAEFVYPIGSTFVSNVDFWIPFVPTAREVARAGSGRTYSLTVIGRLRPETSLDDARTQFAALREALAAEHPHWFVDRGVAVDDLHHSIVPPETRRWMLLLLVAVIVVLVIACLNVANLLIARAAMRARDLTLRAALGASRADLVRAMAIESVLLAVAGTSAGVVLAIWGVDLLRATLPEYLPRLSSVAVDVRVVVIAACAGLATSVVFGVIPAWHFSKARGLAPLHTTRAIGQPGAERIRTAIVIAEVALAVVLVAGAAWFGSTFLRVVSVDLGLDTRNVVAVTVAPRLQTPRTRETLGIAHLQLIGALEHVRRVPGVRQAALIGGGVPISGGSVSIPAQLPGRTLPPFTDQDEPYIHGVTPTYLETVGARLRRGRWILDSDTAGSDPVVVLSDVAARRFFGDREAVGQVVLFGDQPRTVVGIVQGVRHNGPEIALRPQAYIPYVQDTQPAGAIVARLAQSDPLIVRGIREAIAAALPAAVIYDTQSFEEHFARRVAQRQFNMLVIGAFGVLAVAIATLGVYGLIAFLVGQRTRELGVRLALGAAPSGLLRLVFARAARWLAIGLAIGLVAAAWLERFVRAFLFEARPYDPAVYVATIVVVTAAGFLAALGPARRAARTDPIAAFRAE
jgi:predicted permease